MDWRTLRLELAPTGEFPNGSVARCFLVRLPLGEDGTICEEGFVQNPRRATARRYWPSEPDQWGLCSLEGDVIMMALNGRNFALRIDGPIALGTRALIETNLGPLPFTIARMPRSR